MNEAAAVSGWNSGPLSIPAPAHIWDDQRLPCPGDPSIPSKKTRNQGSSVSQATQEAGKEREKTVHAPRGDQAPGTNFCFVCFQSGGRDYAVQIHFVWPGRWVYRNVSDERDESELGENPRLVSESDEVEVMQAIQDAVYQQKGKWKRWLWCYQIRSAEEVKFFFDDVSNGDRVRVLVTPLVANEVREGAERTINNGPSKSDIKSGNVCGDPYNGGDPDRDDSYHTPDCLRQRKAFGTPCIRDRMVEADTRLRGCRTQHWLRDCIQKPESAQRRQFLKDGLLQRSFVYKGIFVREGQTIKPWHTLPKNGHSLALASEMRGVYVTMGWNFGRVPRCVRVGSVYSMVGLAMVWFGTVIWAGRGDWGTAMAFGQLLAASVVLIRHLT